MTALSSFKDSLQILGSRLKAENESNSRDKINLNLDFSRERAGSERRPRPTPFSDFQIPGRPNTISARPRGERPRIEPLFFQAPKQSHDSPELNAHVKKISRNKGIITVNSKQYKSTIDDMQYIAELGNGTSGSVVKMVHKPSNKLIAVKQMHRSGNIEESKRVFFDLEVVLNSHDCPYIVQCLGCFVTDTDVWICMELMSTCLDKLIKKYKSPFPEPVIGKIAVATLKALHYLKESHGVIHRDVKPSNILLDENGNVKLCDFGISGRLVESKANTRSAGCAAYMAPERIDPPDPSKPDYDIRADVWSLGITLVELATGQFPYKDCKTDFEVLTKVLQDAPPTLSPDQGFSCEFRAFVRDCLAKDYKDRPKYKQLLQHPFIKKYEKEQVDVSKWFKEVSRSIESRTKPSPQNHVPSPLLPRSSRSSSRPSFSSPQNESLSALTPPPVAPRRRSKTPDTRPLDKINTHHHLPPPPPPPVSQFRPDPPPVPPHPNKSTFAVDANSSLYSRSSQVHGPSYLTDSSSPSLSCSPSRSIASSCVSPLLPRAAFHSSSSSSRASSYDNHHHHHPHYPHSSLPHHQYGVPVTDLSSHPTSSSYSSKPSSQGYSQYSNPYVPPAIQSLKIGTSSIYSSNANANSNLHHNIRITHDSNPFSSPRSFRKYHSNTSSTSYHHHPQNSYLFPGSSASSSSQIDSSTPQVKPVSSSNSSRCSSTSNVFQNSPMVRKTPEPVSRYGSYLPPHVSPLVCRKIVGNRAGIGSADKKHTLLPSSSPASTSVNSLPPPAASPHYRYTQEALCNSRPYYTPEPQRRIFPRVGQP